MTREELTKFCDAVKAVCRAAAKKLNYEPDDEAHCAISEVLAFLPAVRALPVDIQDFCHDLKTEDAEAFCDGCEEYQKKLFGYSPITELRRKAEEQDPWGMTLKGIKAAEKQMRKVTR